MSSVIDSSLSLFLLLFLSLCLSFFLILSLFLFFCLSLSNSLFHSHSLSLSPSLHLSLSLSLRYCREQKESQELERLLHCDGIWLHALRYQGKGWCFQAPTPEWAVGSFFSSPSAASD